MDMDCQSKEIPSSKTREEKKNKEKVKTEPANSFGQFLREKKAKGSRAVVKLASEEWREMNEEQKAPYKRLYEEEKDAMGAVYRSKKVRNENRDESKKALGKKKGPKINQSSKDTVNGLQLLSEIESLDDETEKMYLEARQLQEVLCSEKLQLKANQMRLDEKINECENIREKYRTLVSQHSSCQPKQ